MRRQQPKNCCKSSVQSVWVKYAPRELLSSIKLKLSYHVKRFETCLFAIELQRKCFLRFLRSFLEHLVRISRFNVCVNFFFSYLITIGIRWLLCSFSLSAFQCMINSWQVEQTTFHVILGLAFLLYQGVDNEPIDIYGICVHLFIFCFLSGATLSSEFKIKMSHIQIRAHGSTKTRSFHGSCCQIKCQHWCFAQCLT